METNLQTKTERQFYIDWLRILLIFSVFLFHVGMIFNSWHWHVKNDTTYKGVLWYSMVLLHQWRMPLLFLVSGASTYFALGKRTSRQYLGERFKRLIIPLVVGVFTLVPVQVYIEKSAQYSSLIDFYQHMFDGIYPTGNFSWHHLWFIVYLFVISLFISPFLRFFKSVRFKNFALWMEKMAAKPLGLNIIIIPLVISQLLLRPYFPDSTNGLFDDWASMAFYIIFFLAGFILLSNKNITESIKKQRYLYLIEAILASVFLVTVPYQQGISEKMANLLYDNDATIVALSTGLTAIGFAKQHLNFNSQLRKIANEAIYPFYLLHQPVIVVVGFFVTAWNIPILMKVFIIIIFSLTITISIYWFLVKSYNLMRVVFGMKPNVKSEKSIALKLKPIPLFQTQKNMKIS